MHARNTRSKGFTIVELLVVIVVIGILAAVVVVAYRGIQAKARFVQKHTEIVSWQRAFEAYKFQNGKYPPSPNNAGYCLGTGFPLGYDGVARCKAYNTTYSLSYKESDSTGMMNELAKVISIPKASAYPDDVFVGPIVEYDPSGIIKISMTIKNDSETCPANTTYYYIGNNTALCYITLTQ